MTQRELLVSTVKFYTSENRGYNIEKGLCEYQANPNSPGCAIGRFLPKDVSKIFDEYDLPGITTILENSDLCSRIPQWLLDLNSGFLNAVQKLHDETLNWNITGISDQGKYKVKSICIQYGLEPLTEDELKHETTI